MEANTGTFFAKCDSKKKCADIPMFQLKNVNINASIELKMAMLYLLLAKAFSSGILGTFMSFSSNFATKEEKVKFNTSKE